MPTDRLEPWHIIDYSMVTTRTTCACGTIACSTQLWTRYWKGNVKESRELGLSETIYANIPFKSVDRHTHTAACPVCLGSRLAKAEKWEKPTSPVKTPSEAQARQPQFAGSAGYGIGDKRPVKPASPPRSLAEIMSSLTIKKKG